MSEVVMLVLSRCANESISFPELEISVEVLKIQGSRVHLGIEADRSVRVLRTELLDESMSTSDVAYDSELWSLRRRINAAKEALHEAERLARKGEAGLAEEQLSLATEILAGKESLTGRSGNIVAENSVTYRSGRGKSDLKIKEKLEVLSKVMEQVTEHAAVEGLAC